ncbi:MAG TPA: 16S rRNA (guanine(527)-N(7))-methyltransferase RsmG [Vicinamibacterales bacterium]|nr:16S rRNA (guanine(527)-N(7))-methyltransferase RsmG [Vicinamibacterales bacterium]
MSVGAELMQALETYYRLLQAWNEKINLTALDVGSVGELAIDRLLIEPLVAVRQVPAGARQAIDIGSGGGSPAIPMKLARPDVAFTLVEAKTRKCAFLREAGRQLGVPLGVETSRYEALLARPDLHESFDVVTMRAVRVEQRVLMGLQAFLRPAGIFLLFRGPSGPSAPASVTPPLQWEATHMLVDALQSRLTVLRKMRLP